MANNIDALVANIIKQSMQIVSDSMIKDVKPKAIDLLKSHALDDFYSSYSPSYYTRSMSLTKNDSYKIDIVKNGFKISSNKFYGDKSMFDIANRGKDYGYFTKYPQDKTNRFEQYNRNAHFLDNAYKELNGGLVKTWLLESLRSKGINCR